VTPLPDDWENRILEAMPPGYDALLDRHLTNAVRELLARTKHRALLPDEAHLVSVWAMITRRDFDHFAPVAGCWLPIGISMSP